MPLGWLIDLKHRRCYYPAAPGGNREPWPAASVPPGKLNLYDGAVTAAQLSVEEKRTPSEVVLLLTGEIDMATVGSLRTAVEQALGKSGGRIVLDFGGVTFCDSQGLSTLITVNRAAHASGDRLVLANVGDFVEQLLDITGLRAAFEIETYAG